MRTRHLPQSILEFGTFSSVASVVGVSALLGFVLIGNWSEAPAGLAPTGAGTAAASPPTEYVSSDPSVPSASSVFGGRADEPAQQVDTF